jgi:transposase
MPMKTNTLLKSETQVRIQQLKLGVDWHADHFRVVRMCDGQSPQPAQRFTPASFLPFVQKQLTLTDQVFVVYEAGPGGFHLHRQLTALGATAFVVHPVKLDPQHKGVVTDKTDARELTQNLDRYLHGNLRAMSVVRVPTAAEEQRRVLSRQREQLRRERMAKKITQEKLAELADLNIRTVQKIEAGHVNILLTTVLRLQKALGCSWNDLMEKN